MNRSEVFILKGQDVDSLRALSVDITGGPFEIAHAILQRPVGVLEELLEASPGIIIGNCNWLKAAQLPNADSIPSPVQSMHSLLGTGFTMITPDLVKRAREAMTWDIHTSIYKCSHKEEIAGFLENYMSEICFIVYS